MFFRRVIVLLVTLSTLNLSLGANAGGEPLAAGRSGNEISSADLNKEESVLNIPIEASTDELAVVLNRVVPGELYRGTAGIRNLTADVKRNGPIIVSAADDYLYFTLPVTMSLGYGLFETRAIPLKLKFKARAGVTPEWRVRTEVHFIGVSDLLAGEIGVGPLSLRPRSIVEGLSHPMQKLLSALITKKVNDLIPLRTQIAGIWELAQKPVLLDKNYCAWLKLTPEGVTMRPFYARDNRVRLNVGLSTLAELVMGPEPAVGPARPLPNLQLINTFDNTFRIALNTDIFYRDLCAIVAPRLLHRQIDSGGKSIVIKDIDLYGDGNRLVIRVETQGSLEGVFHLTARPVFNQRTNVFSVEDVDFDMQTQNRLLQSADWFLHGAVRYMIQEKLNMDLTRQLEESRRLAGKALARVRLNDHLFLRGDISNLKFNDVIVRKDNISIQVYAEGTSAVSFQ